VIDPKPFYSMPVGVRDFDWIEAEFRRYATCVGGHGFVPTFPRVGAWIPTPTVSPSGSVSRRLGSAVMSAGHARVA
jgi:hypothetical protein